MTMNNEFYPVVNDQVANYVDQKKSFLHNRDPDLSVTKQINQIHSFIQKDVNAIILNPVDGNSPQLNRAIAEAHKKGIKIIIVDSQVKTKQIDCTITSNNYYAGVLCARNLMKRRKRAKILLVDQKTAISAMDRINGFVDTLKKSKNRNYQLIGKIYTNGQSETAYPAVKKFMQKDTDFDCIMALNDKTAVGCLAALDSANKKGTLVYSVDGSKDIKQMIGRNPEIAATVAQSPVRIGNTAVKVAYKLIRGQKVPKRIFIPIKLIDRSNINQFDTAGWQ